MRAAGIVGCLALAVLSKESAIVGVGLVAIVAVRGAGHAVTRLGLVAVTVATLVFVFGNQLSAGGIRAVVNIGEDPAATVSALDWLLLQSTAVMRTFGLLLVPYGFTVDYDYDAVPYGLRVLSLMGVGGLFLATWALRKQTNLALGLAWMTIVVLPRLVIQTPRSYFNDHQAYLLVPGFALLMGGLHEWAKR